MRSDVPDESQDPNAAEATVEPSADTEASAAEPATTTLEAEPVAAEPVAAARAAERPEPSTAVEPEQPSLDHTHVANIPAQTKANEESEAPTTAFVPTPDEDAAVRDERARRFGRPREEAGNLATQNWASDPAPAEAPASASTQTMPVAAAGLSAPVVATTPEDPFEEFDDGPTSRAAAHWWSILISAVFVPVSWYLLADGGERTSFNLDSGGDLNIAGPLELLAGALCLFFVLLAARWSSLGAILTGSVSAALGLAYLVVNGPATEIIGDYQGVVVQGLSQLGQNIVDHMLVDLPAGRIALYGFVLIMVGVISHGARRQGRREEKRKAALGA